LKQDRWVNLGPVGRPLGVHGAFFLAESTLTPAALAALTRLRFEADGPEQTVVEAVRHGAGLKLRVAGITSPEAAKTLRGKSVWVPRAVLPPPEPGSYYHFDVVGLSVFADGRAVGSLSRVEPVPGGVDRWWVRTPSGDIGVPASRRFLKHIDLEEGRIDVDRWDELLALDRGDGIR
jgi:16S rRNA processing protein RimM